MPLTTSKVLFSSPQQQEWEYYSPCRTAVTNILSTSCVIFHQLLNVITNPNTCNRGKNIVSSASELAGSGDSRRSRQHHGGRALRQAAGGSTLLLRPVSERTKRCAQRWWAHVGYPQPFGDRHRQGSSSGAEGSEVNQRMRKGQEGNGSFTIPFVEFKGFQKTCRRKIVQAYK